MKLEIQKSYDKFCSFMEKNTLGAEICSYGVALTGFIIAVRRVRPFTKFKKPYQIPNRFVLEKKELIGTVKRIEPNGSLLMVDHKPLITLPFKREGYLPVKIAGVEVNSLGISWLQVIVANKEVTCIPIRRSQSFVECTVTLLQKTSDNKLQKINIGESLVAINFASLSKPIEKSATKDPFLARYFGILKSAEIYALKKQQGLKYYVKPTKIAIFSFSNKVLLLIKTILSRKETASKVAIS